MRADNLNGFDTKYGTTQYSISQSSTNHQVQLRFRMISVSANFWTNIFFVDKLANQGKFHKGVKATRILAMVPCSAFTFPARVHPFNENLCSILWYLSGHPNRSARVQEFMVDTIIATI